MGTTLLIALSDWHVGGRNSQALSRVASLPKLLVEHPGSPPRPDTIVIAVLGDLIDGSEKYPSQAAETNVWVSQQIDEAARALADCVAEIESLYQLPPAVFAVAGNHGARKLADPGDNLESVVYQLAEERTRQDGSRALWHHQRWPGLECVEIDGRRGLLTHRGVAHFETRAQQGRALMMAWEYQADWLLCGHMHHIGMTRQGMLYLRNGSLGNRYDAERLGLAEDPAQLFATLVDGTVVGVGWVTWPGDRRQAFACPR